MEGKRLRMMIKKLAIVALAVVLVSGCENISKTMQSWVGHNVNELIAAWGPPTEILSDDRGGSVFIYARTRRWVQPATTTITYSGNHGYGQVTTVYTPERVESYTTYRMFWIDSEGTIYNWAWRGS